jgi:hypothetical protein
VCARAPSLPSVLAGIYSSSLYGSSSVEDWDDRSRSIDLQVMGRTIPSFRIALAMEEAEKKDVEKIYLLTYLSDFYMYRPT